MPSVLHGDCRELMAAMPAASVDAIVTDPPYGLAFMGKGWDHAVPGVEFWAEALRVAKPGAHLLAFGGTRTFHRLACAIEDAGWEIRDCLSWLYGSGFPKSHDVSKAMDKEAGVQREVVAVMPSGAGPLKSGHVNGSGGGMSVGTERSPAYNITAPATDLARQWAGWGTALKPAWEPIILARAPLAGTVAANVAAHGTGGLNIDGCRLAFADAADEAESKGKNQHTRYANPGSNRDSYSGSMPPRTDYDASGRWPANVVLDEDTAAMLGEASRFFYCAKASRAEREAGLDGMEARAVAKSGGAQSAVARGDEYDAGQSIGLNRVAVARNHHPTVKPIELMRWLVRLVTPAGGVVLDPFTGSGSTGCAAVLEGFDFIGCEREAEYVEIARRRIAHWQAVAADQPLTLF